MRSTNPLIIIMIIYCRNSWDNFWTWWFASM